MFLCCTIGFCAALLIARFPAKRASMIAVNVGNTSAHTRLFRPARKAVAADKTMATNMLTKLSVLSRSDGGIEISGVQESRKNPDGAEHQ
jgi:hypothetical protein